LLTRLSKRHTGREPNRDRQHDRADPIREQSERRVERVKTPRLESPSAYLSVSFV